MATRCQVCNMSEAYIVAALALHAAVSLVLPWPLIAGCGRQASMQVTAEAICSCSTLFLSPLRTSRLLSQFENSNDVGEQACIVVRGGGNGSSSCLTQLLRCQLGQGAVRRPCLWRITL